MSRKSPRWTEEELDEWQLKQGGKVIAKATIVDRGVDMVAELQEAGGKDSVIKKPHKYHAEPTVVDGIRFDSKLEASYYQRLKMFQELGTITGFLRQVPLHLPGKTRLVIDFLIFWPDDPPTFVDTKGYETEVFKVKLRQVRELYPWADIRIVKKADYHP